MLFRKIHNYFSFGRLLRFVLGLAFVIQVVVISYNHLSGYYELESYQHFLIRLCRGWALSILAGFLITYPDLIVIRLLNKSIPWGKRVLKRLFMQISFSAAYAVVISILITLLAHFIRPYREELISVLIKNALIYAVVNLLVMAILEAWIFYIESRRAKEVAEHLKEELLQVKFEVLKSQINPHFMFNSLNVLSGLIGTDVKRAQMFIDEFSQIYRYVLEMIEQPVALLGEEINFMSSYLFLQQIRYGKNLTYSVNIPSEKLSLHLPPLSLQTLLENAIKHNIVNEDKPLHIDIYSEGDYLFVRNNLQPKVSGKSTGVGLKNLTKRYALICEQSPVFSVTDNYYIAKIPLIHSES
ncbi:MAG TPA: hypothetical protein DEO54_08235 [Rikenellaceae bacterium]|jgi:LytS/YehU family sensor histidine kinase|nr:MAG: hypothetical protein A2X20_00385 [Bacteroidetes bacterium GWE2_40_15]PKP05531.1 MAG: hypothetical protein CVU10_11780 [Bacteroidetes bacterium HGW-Bacteroidetes-5]HBZ26210.1 hypothetical protein [Rikenellaceae bacterium]